jgi:hypothetical protein
MLAAGCLVAPAAAQPRAPELRFETIGPAPSTAQADVEHLRTIVRLVGLDDPGGPIRVVLAAEGTDAARSTPAWIAGFADGPSDSVLLFPSRAPRYPHDSLPAVLHHEIAHILIYRAARGRPVPRWFNEGLATLAERAWSFEDRRMLAWAMAGGTSVTADALDIRFQQGPDAAEQAYALSFAFVRSIVERHGSEAPAAILGQLARGTSFGTAYERVTGEPLDAAERRFHEEIGTWERWIPLLTSPFVLWIAVSLLALLAIVVSRFRRAERRRRWDEEDGLAAAGEEAPEEDL